MNESESKPPNVPLIIAMGDHATLIVAITAEGIARIQSGAKGTPYGETLSYEGARPLGLVQNIVILYADDREALIRMFTEAGVDANTATVPGWADKARRGERTDQPKKVN